ncbi:DUF4492 domain-containing protein [Campylobacter majalis]|uniref:DUF4492 domain-containing protein n=1 Tax=Campylobacter majalis TaxID=2790656 RepID=UPI003D699D8F
MSSNYLVKIFKFYIDGFRSMGVGRKLWAIIFIKLLIMFGVLKVFFFDETINTKFKTQDEKSEFILDNLTKDYN